MDFLTLSIHLLIDLFAVRAWYFWEEDFGFRMNLKPRFAMKCMFFCYNYGNQKGVERPFRKAEAAHLKCAELGFLLKDKKNDNITTTLYLCDLLYCSQHLSPFSTPQHLPSPSSHCFLISFLKWSFLHQHGQSVLTSHCRGQGGPFLEFLILVRPRVDRWLKVSQLASLSQDFELWAWLTDGKMVGGQWPLVCCVRSALFLIFVHAWFCSYPINSGGF